MGDNQFKAVVFNSEPQKEMRLEIREVFIPFTEDDMDTFSLLFESDFICKDDDIKAFFIENKNGFIQIPFTLSEINQIIEKLCEHKETYYKRFYKTFSVARTKLEKAM